MAPPCISQPLRLKKGNETDDLIILQSRDFPRFPSHNINYSTDNILRGETNRRCGRTFADSHPISASIELQTFSRNGTLLHEKYVPEGCSPLWNWDEPTNDHLIQFQMNKLI